MNNKLLSTVLVSLFLTAVSTFNLAQAALISFNGYTLQEETNIVSNGTLEWLQWDETINISTNKALASYSGWRLANRTDMNNLFNDMLKPIVPFNGKSKSSHDEIWGQDDSNFIAFVAMFGGTYSPSEINGPHYNKTITDDAIFSFAYYDNGYYESSSKVSSAFVRDSYAYTERKCEIIPNTCAKNEYQYGGKAEIGARKVRSNFASYRAGTALVRDVVIPTAITEPSTYAIFVLCLIFLASRGLK